jgi:hypothetical protein
LPVTAARQYLNVARQYLQYTQPLSDIHTAALFFGKIKQKDVLTTSTKKAFMQTAEAFYSGNRCNVVRLITIKYYFVFKANENIFPRSPIKNSHSTFGRKNVKRGK